MEPMSQRVSAAGEACLWSLSDDRLAASVAEADRVIARAIELRLRLLREADARDLAGRAGRPTPPPGCATTRWPRSAMPASRYGWRSGSTSAP